MKNNAPKRKRRGYRDKLYTHSEEYLQNLIIRAQNHDDAAQIELLEIFDNFLTMYFNVLYYAKFDLNNLDVRRFIALWVKKPSTRYALLKNGLNSPEYKEVMEIVRGIQLMVCRYGSTEDCMQTIQMSYLECVQLYSPKYNEDGLVPFSGYIYAYFYYVLKKRVENFMIDQLGRKTFHLIDDAEIEAAEENTPSNGFEAPSIEGIESVLNSFEIDNLWVLGETAKGAFAILTPQERQLLKWRYVDKMKSSAIANKLTEHQNTQRERLQAIRVKIREYLENEHRELDKIGKEH